MNTHHVLGKFYLTNIEKDKIVLADVLRFKPNEYIPFGVQDPTLQPRQLISRRNEFNNDHHYFWHQDDHGRTPWFILWTDKYPTEIYLPSGGIFRAENNDVVVVNNQLCYHRSPQYPTGTIRHFIRITPSTTINHVLYPTSKPYPNDQIIDEWKERLLIWKENFNGRVHDSRSVYSA